VITPRVPKAPVISISVAGQEPIKAAVWVLPGHPDDCVTLHLGFGRTRAGRVGGNLEETRGFNAYALRTSGGLWSAPNAAIKQADEEMMLACTQNHASMDQNGRNLLRVREINGKVGTSDDVLMAPLAEVTGRQFEWRIRYAGKDGVLGNEDDVSIANDLHVPVNEEVVLKIKSQDVLHSFFLPNLRLKQDVVPGMKQHVWFKANRTGVFDIVCAELCGWGHYKMRGRLTVESRDDFNRWLDLQSREQNRAEFTPTTGEAE